MMFDLEGIRKRTVAVPDQVRDVLSRAEIEGKIVRIPFQLERDLYVAVNKVLEALGGKWDRRVRGHVFEDDPAALLRDALTEGQVTHIKKTVEYFPTPRAVVDQLLMRAELEPGMRILEPSAGRGAIADVLREECPECLLEVIELEAGNRQALIEKGHQVIGEDFLTTPLRGCYDRIIMNPPFSGQQDIDHVEEAFALLCPGGRVVAVMAAGVKFRSDRKAENFRMLVEEFGGTIEDLPPESFREAGTLISAVIVTLDRPF